MQNQPYLYFSLIDEETAHTRYKKSQQTDPTKRLVISNT